MNSKIGLVGYGYWGKILCHNLMLQGYNDITIYDPGYKRSSKTDGAGFPINPIRNKLDKCDKVFIASPASTHYAECLYFLDKGIPIFCEKPLCLKLEEAKKLYEKANGNLFVDWTFLYNDAIWKLKEIVDEIGPPNLVTMNRSNYGPVRKDVSAKHDLASHDVSIMCYLLGTKPNKTIWNEAKVLCGEQKDTCHGRLIFDNTIVEIQAS